MANRTVSVVLQAEIGQYVSGMTKAAAATKGLGDTAETTTTKASKGFDLAGKGSLLMGGAIVAGLGAAIAKSMDFEKSMSAVRAATQASASTMSDLREAAIQAGSDTQYSATEAADAITEMAKAGVSAKDIMGGGLKGALNLAAAGQLDVAEAAGIASTAMTQFNLSGNQLPHVADLLAAGAGKAMGSVDDMGQALNQAGLLASNAGISIEETTGTLAAFASAGLIGSDAGTSFKTMLQQLQNPSKESALLMQQLGINAYDAQGNFVGLADLAQQLKTHLGGLTQAQRDQAIAQIFGSDAARAATVLYKEGAAGIEEWTKKVDDAGYAQRTAADLTDNLSGDLERLGGSFDTLMISLGSGAQGPLREAVQMLGGLVDAAGGAITAFGALPGPIQAGVAAAGLWAVAGGRITEAFGSLKNSGASRVFDDVRLSMMLAREQGEGFRGTLGAIGSSAGSAALGGLKSLARAIGPELGIGLVVAAIPTLVDGFKQLAGITDVAAGAQQRFKSALEQTGGVINDDVRKTAQGLIQDTDGMVAVFQRAGISAQDATSGLLGNAAAQDRVRDALQNYITTSIATEGRNNAHAQTAAGVRDAYNDLIPTLGTAKAAADYFAEGAAGAAGAAGTAGSAAETAAAQTSAAAQAAADAYDKWIQAMVSVETSFVEPLSIYQQMLQTAAQATADATQDSKDSWQDYATNASISLDQFSTKLQEQIINQETWHQNLVIIAQRAGFDVAAQLEQMGIQGAGLVAQMATATDGEMQRMAGLMRQDAANGGAGAAQALDQQMKVMAAVGAAGGGATAKGIADQLNMGINDVAGIAARYGVTLATGLEPILKGLGKPPITVVSTVTRPGVIGHNADGNLYENHQAEIAQPGAWRVWAEPETGGEAYIPLAPSKRGRSLNIWRETGKRLGVPEAQFFADGGLVALGHRLQSMGAMVAEHPAFPPLDMHGHGKTSLHYTGHAIDVNTRPGTSALEQHELAPMAALARSLGFRTIFMAPGHFNHLHVDDGGGGSIGSGGVSAVVLPRPPSTAPFGPPLSTAADATMQYAYDAATAWMEANTVPAPEGEGMGGGGGGAMRALGRSIAAAMGVGGQFGSIDSIFTRESGWNPNAQNPTSSAYGIPQFLNATWAQYGGKTSDPSRQITAGIRYMNDRYGSPDKAKAFWDSHHWYDSGGLATGPGVMAKATLAPERVLSPRQTEAFERWMSREVSGAAVGAGAGAGLGDVTINARVFVGSQEISHIARVEAEVVMAGALTAAHDRGAYNG